MFLNGLSHLLFYDHGVGSINIKGLLHCVWYLVYEWVMIEGCMCTITRHGKRCGYFGSRLGWLNDLLKKVTVSLSMVCYSTLDEVDCMLDMGFETQIHIIFFDENLQ